MAAKIRVRLNDLICLSFSIREKFAGNTRCVSQLLIGGF